MVQSNRSNTQYLKYLGSGAAESVSSDILGLLGLVQGVGNYIVKAPKLLSEDYSHKDLINDSFVDNELMKASEKTKNWIQDNIFGIDRSRAPTSGERAMNILGGVGTGLLSAARGAAKQGAKFTMKEGIKSSSDDAAKAIAKNANPSKLDTMLEWATPKLTVSPNKAGNYLTKENLGKVTSQSIAPFIGSEAVSYLSDSEGLIGDYRKTNPELQEQLNQSDPSQIEDENSLWNFAKKAVVLGAGVWGYKTAKGKFASLAPEAPQTTKSFTELKFRQYMKELEAEGFNKNASLDVAKMENLLKEVNDEQIEFLKLPTRDLIAETPNIKKFAEYAGDLNSLAANPQTAGNVQQLFDTWNALNALRSGANTSLHNMKTFGLVPPKPLEKYSNLNDLVDTFTDMENPGLLNPKTGLPFNRDELLSLINTNMKNPFIKNQIERFGNVEKDVLKNYFDNGLIDFSQYEEMKKISTWSHDGKDYHIYVPQQEASPGAWSKFKKMFQSNGGEYEEGLGLNMKLRSVESEGNVKNPGNPIENIGRSIERSELSILENKRRAVMVKNMVRDARENAPIARGNANKHYARMKKIEVELKGEKDLIRNKKLRKIYERESDKYQNWVSRADYFEKEFSMDLIPGKKSTDGLSNMFSENGEVFQYRIPSKYKDLVAHRPNSAGFWGTMFRKSNRLFAQATTGALNPAFTPTAFTYSMWESIASTAPEIKQIMKEQGKEFSYFGHVFQGLKEGMIAFKDKVKEDWYNFITKNVIIDPNDSSKVLNNSMFTSFVQSPEQLKVYKYRLKNMLESDVGGYSPETNYLSGRVWSDDLVSSIDPAVATERQMKSLNDKASAYLKSSYQYVNESAIAQMMKSLVSASREAAPRALKIRAKALSSNKEQTLEMFKRMSKHITDNTNQGSGRGIFGGFMENFVQNYVPFGRSMVQGSYTKFKNWGAVDALTKYGFDVNEIARSSRNVPEKAWSILMRTKDGLKDTIYSDTAEMMLYYVGIPAAISYLWNNNTENNKKNYYTLTDYDKSSKIILTNMFGDGQHFVVPIDQEFGVLKNMFEGALDGALQLSKDNGYDPAFSSQRLIGKSIERMLNLEMPVPIQAAFAVQGLEVGINPNSLAGKDGGIIRPLGYEQTNLNGTQTIRPDGLYNREAVKLFTSTLGTLGRGLVNASEEYNVADDTKSWSNALGEFSATMFSKDPKNRANNATSNAVNAYRDTISKLSKIMNYKPQDTFRGGLQNDAAPRQMSPEEQAYLPVAQVVIPYYNKNIKQDVDKLSGLYAQIRSYTSSGRDVNGKAISNKDRATYMNEKNIELSRTYASVYNDFKELETLLSEQMGQDIRLEQLFNN